MKSSEWTWKEIQELENRIEKILQDDLSIQKSGMLNTRQGVARGIVYCISQEYELEKKGI